MKSEARACRPLQAVVRGSDFILSATGSHQKILGKEVKKIDSYLKKWLDHKKTRVETTRPVGCKNTDQMSLAGTK